MTLIVTNPPKQSDISNPGPINRMLEYPRHTEEKKPSSQTTFLIKKIVARSVNQGSIFSSRQVARQEIPEKITDLTTGQIEEMWPTFLETDEKEQDDFIKQLLPHQFSSLTSEQLAPVVHHLTENQIILLKSILSKMNQDEIKIFWPNILKMTSDARHELFACLQPSCFALLSTQEIGSVLAQMTSKQINSLNSELFSQLDPETVFNFWNNWKWTQTLSDEKFRIIWKNMIKMDPEDRKVCFYKFGIRHLNLLSDADIGPFLTELPYEQITLLDAQKVKQLFPWILKMSRKERILFKNCLLGIKSLYLLDLQELTLISDNFTDKDLNNINLDDITKFDIAKLSSSDIKNLFHNIINHDDAQSLLNKIDIRQLNLINEENLSEILFSSFSFINFKPEHIQEFWPSIVRMKGLYKQIFINRLNSHQFSLVNMENIHSLVQEFSPIQIEGLWSRIQSMDASKKRELVLQLKPHQLTELKPAQIASVLHLMTAQQIYSLPPAVKSQLKLDTLFQKNESKCIVNFSPRRIQKILPTLLTLEKEIHRAFIQQLQPSQFADLDPTKIALLIPHMTQHQLAGLNWNIAAHLTPQDLKNLWPKISDLSIFEKEALRTLLARLSDKHLALLSVEELTLAIGVLSDAQLQCLTANTVSVLWPSVLSGVMKNDPDSISFIQRLRPHQLVAIKPENRPFQGSLATLEQMDPGVLTETQVRLLNSTEVKILLKNIVKMEASEAVLRILNHLQPQQFAKLGEYELDLLNKSKLIEYFNSSQWKALYPAIITAHPRITLLEIAITKVSFLELEKDHILLLLNKINTLSFEIKLYLLIWIKQNEQFSLLDSSHVQDLWQAFLYLGNDYLYALPHQKLSLLKASDLAFGLSKISIEEIRNLDIHSLKQVEPYIPELSLFDAYYVLNALSPQQLTHLPSLIKFNNQFQENIKKIDFSKFPSLNFSVVPNHQICLWKPEFIKKLWPQIAKISGIKRQALISQFEPQQLSGLDANDLSLVLEVLTPAHIRSLKSQIIQQLWKYILQMSQDKIIFFLDPVQSNQLALLKGPDLLPVLGALRRRHIRNLKVEVLIELFKEKELKPIDRIYLARHLTSDQESALNSAGITFQIDLSPTERDEIIWENITPHQLSVLWRSSLAQHRSILSKQVVEKLSFDQLYALEGEDLASIGSLLTPLQFRAMLPKLLRTEGFMLEEHHYEQLSPEEMILLISAIWQSGLDMAPEERNDFFRNIPNDKLIYLTSEKIGPVLNELEISQIKYLLDINLSGHKIEGLWPWTLYMDGTKRRDLFQLFSPEIWPSFIIEHWNLILNMEAAERNDLLETIFFLMGPREFKDLRTWFLTLNSVERQIITDQLPAEQKTFYQMIYGSIARQKSSIEQTLQPIISV